LTQRAVWKLYVRWVLRPALPSRRAALREAFNAIYAASVPVSNAVWRLRHPLRWRYVKRRLDIARRGLGWIDA
jgi:hypothetical protein